jgi:hypothetical protein
MSGLFRFGAKKLVAAWTVLCLLAYVLVEFLGEPSWIKRAPSSGPRSRAVLALLHDIGMVLLVLFWLAIAWTIWTVGKMLGRRGS